MPSNLKKALRMKHRDKTLCLFTCDEVPARAHRHWLKYPLHLHFTRGDIISETIAGPMHVT